MSEKLCDLCGKPGALEPWEDSGRMCMPCFQKGLDEMIASIPKEDLDRMLTGPSLFGKLEPIDSSAWVVPIVFPASQSVHERQADEKD
jgi:hypothetical protein